MARALTDDVSPSKSVRLNHEISGIYLSEAGGELHTKPWGREVAKETGVQTYFFLGCSPAQPREENGHGPHHNILPQSGVSCQRPDWPGQHWHPFAARPALHVYAVSQDVQRHQRHGVLSAADCGRDRGPRRDLARPWLSCGSYCGGVWIR